ncbi:plasmid pRiA4b ORF-3 family protein [Paraburkholderia sp. BL10I2N1]|uniref:plasmid pRiA4b ORF-3 family protein n=1 Tax=Paraburkholderia sp. BL10I2N1 TaxID=1938796 RepID=UPI00105C42EB|nr:plasmid pRiA4b ORF-3 family protein [Paraburkholderia sp. BL10I2N1]TDN62170.1 pRiA4b ORF-3-like protein [Paraburkholderia sp. BL10I2N1]
MPNATSAVVYRLHVWIRQISPMIWRRLLVRSDSTIADLHYALQIAFGCSDAHLNLFHIHGQDYGVCHDGGTSFSTHPDQVRLCDFKFRINERFRYEYNFGDGWQHEVRVEARLALYHRRTYPCCIGGKRRAPPEDCGGPLAFMARRDAVPSHVADLLEDIQDDLDANDIEAIRDRREDIEELCEWLTLDEFDRRGVNHRLKQYATHDEAGIWQ